MSGRFLVEGSEKTLSILPTKPTRSNKVLSSAKRCFEFQHISGVIHFYAGFSFEEETRRRAASYYGGRYYNFDGSFSGVISSLTTTDYPNPICLCIDTEKSVFTMINSSTKLDFPYSKSSTTWNVYIDNGGSTQFTAKINVGSKRFFNKMPAGYLPWAFEELWLQPEIVFRSCKCNNVANSFSIFNLISFLFSFR